MLHGIDDAFINSGIKVETYVTFMDMKRIPPSSQYFSKLKELIKGGYNGVRFDAVLACDNDALEFLRKYRDELFPKVPVIFSSINDFEERMLDGRKDITGTSENTDYGGTIRIALKLRPATKDIVVVIDNTTTGRAHSSAVEKIRHDFPQNLNFTYLSLADLTLDELAQSLSQLKNDSIVLLLQHFVDKNGTAYTVQQSTPLLAKSSPVPVFVLTDIRIGLGTLGGHVVSGYHHGEVAAQMVVKILTGTDIKSIPVLLDSPNKYMFDYVVLQRFNIRESNLPQGSILVNKPLSLLDEYKPYLFAILCAFIVLSGVLVYLLLEIQRRRKIENSLRESEDRFHSFFDLTADLVCIATIKGNFVQLNDLWERVLGYSKQELMEKSFIEFIHPEDRDSALQVMKEKLEQGLTVISFENRYLRKDGGHVWLEWTSRPIPEKGLTFAIARDITDRKRIEQALQDSEQRYHDLFDQANEGLLMMTPDGKLPEVNQAFAEMHGYTVDELKCMDIRVLDVLQERTLEARADIISRIKLGEVVRFEVEHYHKDGHTFPLSVTTSKIHVGGQMYFLAFHQDITERKRVEAQTRELLLTLESVPNGIVIHDADGNFLYANQRVCDMHGYRWDEFISLNLRQITEPASAKLIDARMREISSRGEVSFEVEHIKKDGTILPLWVNVKTATWGGKKVSISVEIDLTERRRDEDEKRSLEERLRRSEKMEALGQLAGGVAHDLNNVLGILSGYSELLLMEIPEGSRSRGHVEKILQSTGKGAAIIQDLLTLARRGVTVSDVINLNSIISGFLKAPAFEGIKDYHRRVIFNMECEPNLLNIKGSPIHLEKTLLNLVSNAAESISDAGKVTIRTENRYLDKPLSGYDEVNQGDYVVLTVSDTGMGIPTENRKKIFEPFYTKKAMGRSGTGLGLAIVWGTVKDHNGYIDVQTEVGKGTTFTLYFPVTREELIAPKEKEIIEQYMGKGDSVLVVDDIAEQRDVASSLLTRLGYDVHTVFSGEEALEYLKNHKADMLVIDMIMAPGIDGLETYQKILEINPIQKAILVSGFSETDRVKEALSLGAGAYVKKPYVLETIGVAIRDELARK